MWFERISLTDRAVLAQQWSVMLQSGLTLAEVLETSLAAAPARWRPILVKVSRAVTAGQPLTKTLGDHRAAFGGVLTSAVAAGEISGTLADNLRQASVALEKEAALRAKIIGALIYPILVLATTLALGLILAFFVLPKITPLFAGLGIDLPLSTRVLLWLAGVIERLNWILPVTVVASPLFLFWLFRRPVLRPATHWVWLHFPLLGRLVGRADLARSARTLALMLQSGLPIDEALTVTAGAVTNYHYRRAWAKIGDSVRQGGQLAKTLVSQGNLFPPIFTNLVRVGEESGRLSETLFYLADFYEAAVERSAKNLSTVLEPALLLIIGLVVAGFALSIITPIYQLTGNLRR